MANKKSKAGLILLSFLHTMICILSGSQGWDNQMLVVTITGMAAVWLLFRTYPAPLIPVLAVVLPFYLIYVPFSIYLRSYQTYPIWILGMISVVAAYVVLKNIRSMILRVLLLALIPAIGAVFVMPNNFSYVYRKENLSSYQIQRASLVDQSGTKVSLDDLKGKVVVFDVWSSSCIICIKKFPDLQKLHDRYRHDSTVKIISLNIPLDRDKQLKPEKFTMPYSFGKLYFSHQSEADKLSIKAVPLILIFDKNLSCRYAGDLNFGWNIFIGNVETIIDNLKSEK